MCLVCSLFVSSTRYRVLQISTPNMTGQGFHRTTEVIPRRPWKSKSPFASRTIKTSKNTGTQGVHARYDAVLPPIISIIRSPGRPVILVPEKSQITDRCVFSLEIRFARLSTTPMSIMGSFELREFWEVLNGVGVDGVGVICPFFYAFFPFFFAFLCFS